MERAKVNIPQPEICHEVDAVSTVVRPVSRRVTRIIEETLITGRHQMIRVNRLDKRGYLVDPAQHNPDVTPVGAPGQVSRAVRTAAGLVAKLPRKDGR